jgi:two-component system CheB/CheR fusion protein
MDMVDSGSSVDGPEPRALEPSHEIGPDAAPANPGCLVVGVGASAGGLAAFQALLGAMPPASGMAFVLVPHLDPTHQSLMVELLARVTAMQVSEATDRQRVVPDHVYVIPPGKSMTIRAGKLRLAKPSQKRGSETAIDDFLASLAADCRDGAVGIVMSGTGNHGSRGLAAIKQHGGMVIVQRPETAAYDSMPRSAIATGVADLVLAPDEMPEALLACASHPFVPEPFVESPLFDAEELPLLERILEMLRDRLKADFRYYRKNMVLRRIRRRMGLCHIDQMVEYLKRLEGDASELAALQADLLIGVTAFFRDAEAFRVIEEEVIPQLVGRSAGHGPVRAWVAGCSSGEEAYSIGMLLLEQFAKLEIPPDIKIFASDIDEEAIAVGRRGVYTSANVSGLRPDRLERFFTKLDGDSYAVDKALRGSVVFAVQNLITDSPFPRMDLISCRNLLIYLEPNLQDKVIALAHSLLNPGGYLVLGPSESVGKEEGLFHTISKKWRIYQQIESTTSHAVEIPVIAGMDRYRPSLERLSEGRRVSSLRDLLQKELIRRYAPAAVLVGQDLLVHCFEGPTSNYLEFPPGEPTRDLQALARKGLRTKVRHLVHEAFHSREIVTDARAHVERDGTLFPCRVTVVPLGQPQEVSRLAIVVFEERESPSPVVSDPAAGDGGTRVVELEQELRTTREDLQDVISGMERSNEELRAYNEEVLSMNEELQSVNEELETSKEELQSVNEEMNSVNSQLSAKVDELNALNDDISNLLDSTQIATLFLSPDLKIRRFTPTCIRFFRLLPGDVGRPISDVAHSFAVDQLVEDCHRMLAAGETLETEVTTNDGRIIVRRIMPYFSAGRNVAGAVVTFVDVTDLRRASELVRLKEERLRLAVDAASLVTFEWDRATDRVIWSSRAMEILGFEPATMNDLLKTLRSPDEAATFKRDLQSAYETLGEIRREFQITRPDGTVRWLGCEGRSLGERSIQSPRMVGVLVDFTERKTLEESLATHMHLLRTSSRRLIEAQETERKHLSRELHDQIGQMLVLIKISLQSLGNERLRNLVRAKVQESLKLLDQTLNLVRGLALELRPMILDDLGLVSALQNKARELSRQVGFEVTVVAEEPLGSIASEVENTCYRIALEALTNAAAHGHAHLVQVELRREAEGLVLTVSDDGVGFDVESQMASDVESIGLHTMRERAELTGGEFEIVSKPGGGTTVRALFRTQ